MGFIIGQECRSVKAKDAMSVIAGYVICNDYSIRDWQMRATNPTMGKSFDTHGPVGPWIVTPDELPDPYNLTLRVLVNGELRQETSTHEMIHKIPEMIEELSSAFSLQPGDIISTGSPAGVGGLMHPPQYLKIGDVVRTEIDGIGFIENSVIKEIKAVSDISTTKMRLS